MGMEINSMHGNYADSYISKTDVKKAEKTTEKDVAAATTSKGDEAVRKTAADELSYLSKKYDGITFVAADFKPGMRYGSLKTTNIAISPEFLQKMANDPELEKQYADQFEGMKKLDEQNIISHEAQGRRLIAQGWAIDKNGGMSKWGISEATDKRHYGQEMNDYANKVRQQKTEKKKAEAKIAERRKENAEQQEALKEKQEEAKAEKADLKDRFESNARELLGDKFKGEELIDAADEATWAVTAENKNDARYVGVNLDMKL